MEDLSSTLARHILLDSLRMSEDCPDHETWGRMLLVGVRAACIVLGADQAEIDGRPPASPGPDLPALAHRLLSTIGDIDPLTFDNEIRARLVAVAHELRGFYDQEPW